MADEVVYTLDSTESDEFSEDLFDESSECGGSLRAPITGRKVYVSKSPTPARSSDKTRSEARNQTTVRRLFVPESDEEVHRR